MSAFYVCPQGKEDDCEMTSSGCRAGCDTPRTASAMAECGKLGSVEQMYGYMTQHAKELERELQRQAANLEDRSLCRDGLWLCSVGEKLSRRLEAVMKSWRCSKCNRGMFEDCPWGTECIRPMKEWNV